MNLALLLFLRLELGVEGTRSSAKTVCYGAETGFPSRRLAK